MNTWSEGYRTDVNYTYGYQKYADPKAHILPLLMHGLAPSRIRNACELGFGFGLSVNIHAAAGGVTWWGTDFNPNHAYNARHMAELIGNGAQLFDQSFAEFLANPDVPSFDFIVLHGIWSWVSLENQNIIVDFIKEKLNIGGIVYMSYNVLPGWNAKAPLRHLMTQYVKTMGNTNSSSIEQFNDTLSFLEGLLPLMPSYAAEHPISEQFLRSIQRKDPHYLVHEYLNETWQPDYFSDIHARLSEAKLSYACSVNFLDDFDVALFGEEQRKMLGQIKDISFAQTLRDFICNRQFRCDYWVKGKRQLNEHECREYWRALEFALVTPLSQMSDTLIGDVTYNAKIYQPIVQVLQDHQFHPYQEIIAAAPRDISEQSVREVLALLHSSDHLVFKYRDEDSADRAAKCRTLNTYIANRSRKANDISYLASPEAGAGVFVPRLTQLFLLADEAGCHTPPEVADYVWQILQDNGEYLLQDGKKIDSKEQSFAFLMQEIASFTENRPILQTLGLLDV